MSIGTRAAGMAHFEQGPIRPPNEAGSLLLRFTRNCPWNKCTFCPVYKKDTFSRRSLEEIKQDIDTVAQIVDDLKNLSRSNGLGEQVTRPVLNTVLTRSGYSSTYRHVAMWYYSGRGTVFIQDANSLMLPADVLISALQYLKDRVPGITRITSYARSSTLARKSAEDLKAIREAGLDRIHIGLESGSDRVLQFVKKGTSAEEHVEAGRKVIEAGITLSEYIMPGLGGKALWREHAIETARVLNSIDPHFIRLRSLRIPSRAPLHEDVVRGRFAPLSDDETVSEIRLMIETLEGIHSTLTSDHIMNLLPEVEGTFPGQKERMLAVIDHYLALPDTERLLFRLGRRGGALHSCDDLENPGTRSQLERALRDIQAEAGADLETIITELGDQYI